MRSGWQIVVHDSTLHRGHVTRTLWGKPHRYRWVAERLKPTRFPPVGMWATVEWRTCEEGHRDRGN